MRLTYSNPSTKSYNTQFLSQPPPSPVEEAAERTLSGGGGVSKIFCSHCLFWMPHLASVGRDKNMKTLFQIPRLLALTSLMATGQAQIVSIPDPGLNAAILAALGRIAGPLTIQDMLTLTKLNASGSGAKSLARLKKAYNMTDLDLSYNQLTNFSFLSPWMDGSN